MSQQKRPSKRPRPAGSMAPPPARAGGGGNFLDSILGNIGKLHTEAMRGTPAQRQQWRNSDLESDSPYMLPKAAPVGFQALAPGQRMSDYARCRNPTCNSTSFDNDARGGDRVCNQCGVVQNVRSIENLEEEHRSFNDDDGKSEAKKRVERVSHDGRLVAKIGGNDAMRRIHAAATAEGEGEKSKKDQEKLDELKSKIARLCGIDTSIDSESKQDAYHLADVLVNSEIAHRERCWDPKCRLAGKIAGAPVIVAGGILHEALRERGFGRGFEEIAFLVQKSEDGERSRAANVTPKQIGEATEKVKVMCLYHQTFQGAYYTCCPRIKLVKVSAILAQFWRNSAQFCAILAILAQLF